ncbi:hypothetical protein [Cupriavidus sp. TMH.W2]|uniref:hypothetical protein n=1 Tax=Cupriavidus sp. TMH.W2 TaxID=3434465 RepID=UPI003D7854F0
MDIRKLYKAEPLESILNKALFRGSSYGTALAVLFVIFHTEIEIQRQWLPVLDSAFALSASIFFAYFTHLISTTHRVIDENPEYLDGRTIVGRPKKIIGFLSLLGIFFGGLYFIDLANRSRDTGMAATVIGFLMLGSSLVLLINSMRGISKE